MSAICVGGVKTRKRDLGAPVTGGMSVSVDAVTENFVIFGSSLEPLALEGRIPVEKLPQAHS